MQPNTYNVPLDAASLVHVATLHLRRAADNSTPLLAAICSLLDAICLRLSAVYWLLAADCWLLVLLILATPPERHAGLLGL